MIMQSMSNFTQRLIVGSLSTILMFLAIYFSFDSLFGPFFVLLIASIAAASLWEFYSIAKALNYQPLSKPAIVCSSLYIFAVYLNIYYAPYWQTLPLLVMYLTLIAIFAHYFFKGDKPFINIGVTLFGLVYLALPLGTLISINYFFPLKSFQDGRIWLIYLLLVTKVTDIGAYAFGKKFGSIKITPYISPSKTLEGAIGGLLVSTFTSILFCYLSTFLFSLSIPLLPLFTSVWLGALISLVAQFGDLAESLLKRDGKIKDSNQLPGLGGVLDVVDSLVFTAPLLYLFLQYHESFH